MPRFKKSKVIEPNYSVIEFEVEMERSWLVQRLKKPWGRPGDNPFSFGGGLRNGGLREDAMALLRPCFEFDYMGAAEFEFGAVPEALQKMVEHGEHLIVSTLTIPLADIEQDWRDAKSGLPAPEGEATIYVICHADMVGRVHERITGWALPRYNSDLKESTHLGPVLRPAEGKDYHERIQGWLELNNGFMFFTDSTMFTRVGQIFGVVEVTEDVSEGVQA